MAASMAFPGQALGNNMLPKASKGLTLSPLPNSLTASTNWNYAKRMQKYGCAKKSTRNIQHRDHKRYAVISSISSSNSTPSETVEQFYECINEKNLKKLGKFISNDCFFEDFSFPKPFQGKKEVLKFFEQLTTCMGTNVEIKVGTFYEEDGGDRFNVVVNWHLEWKKNRIPFTRGCSLYELSKEGERLMIMKVQVMIESPIKPGVIALNLLKIVTSLFDAFPEAAEWFLRSPHVILHKIYNVVSGLLTPLIKPLLACYINIWNFTALVLSLTLRIYIQISKAFNK